MEKPLILQNINNLRPNSLPGTGLPRLTRRRQHSRPLNHKWNQHATTMEHRLRHCIVTRKCVITLRSILLLNRPAKVYLQETTDIIMLHTRSDSSECISTIYHMECV